MLISIPLLVGVTGGLAVTREKIRVEACDRICVCRLNEILIRIHSQSLYRARLGQMVADVGVLGFFSASPRRRLGEPRQTAMKTLPEPP
jgi:hypothetical protein